jgi:hypothetical protein
MFATLAFALAGVSPFPAGVSHCVCDEQHDDDPSKGKAGEHI